MTNQNYSLTPAHFVRWRTDIERRRALQYATFEAAKATVDGHPTAVAMLDAELIKLDAGEVAALIAARYLDESDYGRKARSHKRKTYSDGSPRANACRPYTAVDKARITAAADNELKMLARDMGRPIEGMARMRQKLLKQIRKGDAAVVHADRQRAASGSEAPATVEASVPIAVPFDEIVEPSTETTVDDDPLEFLDAPAIPDFKTIPDRRAPLQNQPGPVRNVTGRLMDNGPTDQKTYHHPGSYGTRAG